MQSTNSDVLLVMRRNAGIDSPNIRVQLERSNSKVIR
jgi:hypothetical protein